MSIKYKLFKMQFYDSTSNIKKLYYNTLDFCKIRVAAMIYD